MDRALQRYLLEGVVPRAAGWAGVAKVAARKLDMLGYAKDLTDLASPSGNRLEALKGDLARLHNTRISAQWRVVFPEHPGREPAIELV